MRSSKVPDTVQDGCERKQCFFKDNVIKIESTMPEQEKEAVGILNDKEKKIFFEAWQNHLACGV